MTRGRPDHHGPTARERAVLELAEAGKSKDEIAEQLQLTPKYVYQVVQALLAPAPSDWQTPARRGSQSLIAAIRRHHPERCTPHFPSSNHSIPGSARAAGVSATPAAQPLQERAA